MFLYKFWVIYAFRYYYKEVCRSLMRVKIALSDLILSDILNDVGRQHGRPGRE